MPLIKHLLLFLIYIGRINTFSGWNPLSVQNYINLITTIYKCRINKLSCAMAQVHRTLSHHCAVTQAIPSVDMGNNN